MKRPQIGLPLRAASSAGRIARCKKEAAIQLVRIEFDISRLEMALTQAEQRSRAHSAELALKTQDREALLRVLNS